MNFKTCLDLMRMISSESIEQVALQYIGRSVTPAWPNGELVVSTESEERGPVALQIRSTINVILFGTNDRVLNEQVVHGIRDANPGVRLIIVQDGCGHIQTDQNLCVVLNVGLDRDLVETLIAFCNMPNFSIANGRYLVQERLKMFRLHKIETLSPDKHAFIATAQGLPDREGFNIGNGWTCISFKTLYPVLRDLTDFRGILVAHPNYGTFYRESTSHTILGEVERLRDILSSLSCFLTPTS